MSAYDPIYQFLDTKTRRKLKDERRMRFRRAIERYDEDRSLHTELEDYPELKSIKAQLVEALTRPYAKTAQLSR
ncbi:hypothetical protein LX59_01167 [Azomonas agilis]|uniref:Uncharacterized protein n=1 Tax=Azomonas agilis TaxID=116849 RepID=A0A562IZB6_9GAMM|nr:hypothetical protein [Azomonas agilis]TWH76246.1 hypothetical protein LX59_01167 [Azomonas agilis]